MVIETLTIIYYSIASLSINHALNVSAPKNATIAIGIYLFNNIL